ncbi:MATE efflux family protein 3, chloroplastic [Hordeum vulgare]|nr:MATE efflux family protein 3, chloroplastic [Hordeum vulgare]
MFYCINGAREGFLKGCRPFIGVDGCFIKLTTGAQLLVATGRDGNNNIYRLAFDSLEKALAKLWDMYEESKATRTIENLERSFLIHNLTQQNKKLDGNYEKLYGDVNALLDQQQRVVDSVEENNLKDNTNLQQKYDILNNLTAAQAKGAAAAVVALLVDTGDVLLSVLAGALEVPVVAVEALLAGVVVLLSPLAGALEVPDAVVEALLAGALGGVFGGAPTD